LNSQKLIERENLVSSKNYAPLPVVLERGKGVHLWDADGKRYLDFLSGYSVVNQGHCHPRIVAALTEQAGQLTQVSRAFHCAQFAPYAEKITKLLGYDRVLALNTGVEAVEAAIKLVRKWAVKKKGLEEGQAKILFADGNFHGRTMSAVSASTSPEARKCFGPFLPNLIPIPYNDLGALERALTDPTVAAFVVEPIQGEAGVVVPHDGYLKSAYDLCHRAGALLVADEIQTGLGRTGKMLASEHEGVKPDILLLGKALSGGMMPVSAVLADDEVMLCFEPGDHGSTFGGNPLACVVAQAALDVLVDEKLAENAEKMGRIFREELKTIKNPRITEIRGRGLLNAVVVTPIEGAPGALEACHQLLERGLLAKNTRKDIIRFAPPLVIDEEKLREGIAIIRAVLEAL
jgi:ornithine--oxo-acid transaminase